MDILFRDLQTIIDETNMISKIYLSTDVVILIVELVNWIVLMKILNFVIVTTTVSP